MLRKKEVYTIVTPIPSFIPRQLAVDILHSHGEVITLNPLVLGYKQIDAPRNAAADEYFSTWYEILERVQFVPGMGKFGAGKISFNACFHDLPWGLQTHVYAPLSIDMRNKYRICGNQPGFEPPEPPEIGLAELGVPKNGLYLREDIEIRCNITMISTVKAQMKAASKDMVERIIKKAELLDAGILQAMVENGMMKTYKPTPGYSAGGLDGLSRSPQPSPAISDGSTSPTSPTLSHRTMSPGFPYQIPRPLSGQAAPPPPPPLPEKVPYLQVQQHRMAHNHSRHGSIPAANSQDFAMELPGDFYYSRPPPPPPADNLPVELPTHYQLHEPRDSLLRPSSSTQIKGGSSPRTHILAHNPASYGAPRIARS